MAKRILIGIILATFITSCFAGYSSGGRSGFSGGSRGYSSARSYSSSRAYVAPRTYSRSYSGSSRTTVVNNHYNHGGFGGAGFFNGFLGGYIGGSMATMHQPMIVGGTVPVIGAGQGALVEGGGYGIPVHSPSDSIAITLMIIIFIFIILLGVVAFIMQVNHDPCKW